MLIRIFKAFFTQTLDQYQAGYHHSLLSRGDANSTRKDHVVDMIIAKQPRVVRHSFAAHLYTEDVDITVLGKLLGQSTIAKGNSY